MGTKAIAVLDIASGIMDDEGNPLAGGKIYFYDAGTVNDKEIYLDRDKTTPAAQPVVLDIYGRAELYGDGLYKLVIKNSDDVTLWDLDNVELVPLEGGTYDDVTINPTNAQPVTGSLLKFTVSLEDSNGDIITKFSEIQPYLDFESTYNDLVDLDSAVATKDPIYWDSSSSTWKKADLLGKHPEAFCITANDDGDGTYSGKILYSGKAKGLSGVSAGTDYYLDTNGGLTAAETSWYVGKGISTTSMLIQFRKTQAGQGSGSIGLSELLEVVREARKRGSDIPVPFTNYVLNAGEKARVTIPLHTSYTGGTTTLKLTQKIFIEDGNYVPIFITDDTTGNYDLIWLDSLTGETTGEYTYSLVASVSNSYTTANSAYVTNSTGTSSGGEIKHNPDVVTGDVELNADTLLFSYTRGGQVATAIKEMVDRIFDDKYPADLTNFAASKQIIFDDGGADVSAQFKNDNYILLSHELFDASNNEVVYPYEELKQYRGADTKPWYIFQLDANGTYSSPDVTVTVDQVLDLASGTFSATMPTITDMDNWHVVRLPGLLKYLAGSKTSTTFTQAVPSEVIINQSTDIVILEDDFNRSNENPITSRGWQGFTSDGLSSNRWQISSNELYSFSALTRQVVWQEGIVTDDFSVRFKFKTRYNTGSGGQRTFFRIGSNETPSDNPLLANSASGKGLAIRFGNDGGGAGTAGTIYYDGELKATYSGGFADNVYFYLKIEKRGKQIKVKRWLTSVVEPDAFDFSFGVNSSGLSGRSLLFYNSSDGSQYAFHVDDFILEGAETGYTLKYSIPNLTNIEKFGIYAPNNRGVNTGEPIRYLVGGGLIE